MQVKDLQWKRALRTALLVLLMSAAGMGKMYADFYNVPIGDLRYDLNDNTMTATVRGHVNGMAATGTLTIPEFVPYNGSVYSVNRIDSYVFNLCNKLTGDLIIPNSVTTIDEKAFQGCSGFTGNLIIGNSVTEIGYDAFNGCSKIVSLTLGNSVTTIGIQAFCGCDKLSSVTFPNSNSLTLIGSKAFFYDDKLYSITIPNSVTYVGEKAFSGTGWYDNQPDGILYLDDWCLGYKGEMPTGELVLTTGTKGVTGFRSCTGLTSVSFPSSLMYIAAQAFDGCSGLTGDLVIPNSVTTIGAEAFNECGGLTGDLTIPNSVTTIGDNAFYACSGFTGSLTIGNSVSTIGEMAFQECSGFTGSLTIPNSVTTIGFSAFSWCSGFTGSLTIPNSVTTIGDWAFSWCNGFTGNLTIGNSVTEIGSGVFSNCSGLEQIIVASDNAYYDSRENCNAIIETNTNKLVTGCKNTVIPSSVTTIGIYAFSGCSGLTGSLVIPNSVTSIGWGAFEYCNGLASLTIGNSVASIGNYAFSGCSSLSSIIVLTGTPPTLGDYSWDATTVFSGVDKSIPVYVPYGTVDDYSTAPGWNEFTNYQVIAIPPFIFTQAIELNAGWNWFSTNVEITLEDLQNALVDAAPNTNITIKSNAQNIAYNSGTNQWRGTLDSLDVSQMYMIQVGAGCQITLTGTPINPNACPITIHNGNNWIAFPLSESMSVSDAFSGFATNGDIIKGRTTTARYNNGSWRGGLDSLEPGQGYIYKTNVTETRTFTFPASAK